MKLFEVKKMIQRLNKIYPELECKIEYNEELGHFSIKINNSAIYHSRKFKLFLLLEHERSFRTNKTFNVFFTYKKDKEKEKVSDKENKQIIMKKLYFAQETEDKKQIINKKIIF